MDDLITRILEQASATEYRMYLTAAKDSTAFRKQIYPEYKGNRKAPRPVHYEELRKHLVEEHGASVSTTIEADDAIGIDSNYNFSSSVIVSIDKDLLQLPGLHFNFVKGEFKTVTKEQGIRWFYKQLLMGDKADNIRGIEGIGEVKAERILNSAEDYTEESWFDTVRNAYNNDQEMWMNGECLWILREHFPQGTFSFHPLGSQLLQEMDEKPWYLQKPNADTSESTTQEISMDGVRQPGTNLQENSNPSETQQLI